MIISHKYKYIFIEIPLTASWAIREELCRYYGGEPILNKHSTYPEFQRLASKEEKKYFKFATVRNPLDEAVSAFFKLKMDHKKIYSNSDDSLRNFAVDYADVMNFKSQQGSDLTFEVAFLRPRLWERPYSSLIETSSSYLDYVIRFENLDKGFGEVLGLLGIEQVRPIPITNKTQGRKADWSSYYSPVMIEKAKKIFGPFMQKWGYEFPPDWGDYHPSRIDILEFRLVNFMKKTYMVNFRYNNKSYAKMVRILNAYVKKSIWR